MLPRDGESRARSSSWCKSGVRKSSYGDRVCVCRSSSAMSSSSSDDEEWMGEGGRTTERTGWIARRMAKSEELDGVASERGRDSCVAAPSEQGGRCTATLSSHLAATLWTCMGTRPKAKSWLVRLSSHGSRAALRFACERERKYSYFVSGRTAEQLQHCCYVESTNILETGSPELDVQLSRCDRQKRGRRLRLAGNSHSRTQKNARIHSANAGHCVASSSRWAGASLHHHPPAGPRPVRPSQAQASPAHCRNLLRLGVCVGKQCTAALLHAVGKFGTRVQSRRSIRQNRLRAKPSRAAQFCLDSGSVAAAPHRPHPLGMPCVTINGPARSSYPRLQPRLSCLYTCTRSTSGPASIYPTPTSSSSSFLATNPPPPCTTFCCICTASIPSETPSPPAHIMAPPPLYRAPRGLKPAGVSGSELLRTRALQGLVRLARHGRVHPRQGPPRAPGAPRLHPQPGPRV